MLVAKTALYLLYDAVYDTTLGTLGLTADALALFPLLTKNLVENFISFILVG